MKRFLMLLAIASVTSVAIAQNTNGYENADATNKHQVFTNKFGSNWFFSFGGGGEMLFGNKDVHADFKDRISPTFNVAVGKWFTPGLGLRIQYSGFQGRGYTADATNPYVDGAKNSDGYYDQEFKYMNLHGDVMFNLNALFGGYNEHRVYEIIPYIGGGFTHNYDKPNSQGFTLNGGIINKFRLSSAWDINLELSFMGAQNKFDAELGGKRDADGVAAATIGFTYKIPHRGFTKPQPAKQLISEAELRNIRERMNEMAAENQVLRTDLAEAKKPVIVKQEVEVVDPDIAPRSVFFNIGSSKLSDSELINLGFIADQMKEYPNMKFKVKGYADSSTGSQATNERLSQQRAHSVVDALVNKHGIARDRFVTIEGMGGVTKFDKAYLNRMALIEMVK